MKWANVSRTRERISDERFEEILVQGLADDYEFVKMTSFHISPNGGIDKYAIDDAKLTDRWVLETKLYQQDMR